MGSAGRKAFWCGTFFAVVALGGAGARAGYFVAASAQSPLAAYFNGDVDQSAAAAADSSTFFVDPSSDVFSAQGSSSVDLSTGSLHALASTVFEYDPGTPPYGNVAVFANAGLGDTFTFKGNFTGQTATFHLSINGGWSNVIEDPSIDAHFQLDLFPAGTIDANAGNIYNLLTNPPTNFANDRIDIGPSQTFPYQLDVPFTLNGTDPSVDLSAWFNINGNATLYQAYEGDFSHTALITVDTPPGATVYSSSGLFPGTLPLPDPAGGAAMIGVFALLPLARRRP